MRKLTIKAREYQSMDPEELLEKLLLAGFMFTAEVIQIKSRGIGKTRLLGGGAPPIKENFEDHNTRVVLTQEIAS